MALVVYDTPESRKRAWWDVYHTPDPGLEVMYRRPNKVRRRLFAPDNVVPLRWRVARYKPLRTGNSVIRKFARRRRKL